MIFNIASKRTCILYHKGRCEGDLFDGLFMISTGLAREVSSLAQGYQIEIHCMDHPSLNAVNAVSWVRLVLETTRHAYTTICLSTEPAVAFTKDAVLFLEEVSAKLYSFRYNDRGTRHFPWSS